MSDKTTLAGIEAEIPESSDTKKIDNSFGNNIVDKCRSSLNFKTISLKRTNITSGAITAKEIGYNYVPYFIADIGANHDGSLERAYRLIDLAKEAGADAAKFQNFQARAIVSKYGFENMTGQLAHQAKWSKSVYEVYDDASISRDWTAKLKMRCDDVGIDYFTSPYDFDSVDHVDPFVDFYKVGSGDITWLEIIEHIARKGKPVMLATGASSIDDVIRAMNVLSEFTSDIVLMQCNTNYTGDVNNFRYVNLNVLNTYKQLYPNVVLGLSDHTPGHATVLAAVALGASVIEKHFTDDNARSGPDHAFAMNPNSWREMVARTNEVYCALGDGTKKIEANEFDSAVVQRRCIRARADIKKGSIISAEALEMLRPIPADGIPPYMANQIVGRRALCEIAAGEHLSADKVTDGSGNDASNERV